MRIAPFRGYRFRGGAGGDISPVVAPPYDQIDAETEARLVERSAWNIVRVTLPREAPGLDRYTAARHVLEGWLAERVWVADDTPAIYPYQQIYGAGGRRVTRTGFVALGEVTPYTDRIVLPHERTHAGPKRDRMQLLTATAADIGLLFMLVSDPGGDLGAVTAPAGPPIAEARDLRGEQHRLWRITDPGAIARAVALMAPRQAVIADGHHRYETAAEIGRQRAGARAKLMAFFPLEGPGLTILPNHRLVRGLPRFDFGELTRAAGRWFDVAPLDDPLGFRPGPRAIGVVAGRDAAVLRLRADAADRIAWPEGTSPAWRALAVSILHEGLLRPLLGITDEILDARTHVDYTADQADAVRRARQGRDQAAFLIAATTPEELQAVVQGGEVLPQKSTHFYPKLLDGLLFHMLEDKAPW